MSRLFGPVTQNGYVVPDLDEAMRHWSGVMGVGPWYHVEVQSSGGLYRGRQIDCRLRLGLSFAGDLQIELIEQIDDKPSIYQEFMEETGGKGGLQHISSWPSAKMLDAAKADFVSSGLEVIWEGEMQGSRFVFFDSILHPGTMIEMCDLSENSKQFFAHIRAEAAHWDGSDPIRSLER